MSQDASIALLTAVRSALIADPDVTAIVGDRVSSDWAADLAMPMIKMQIRSIAPYEADCEDEGRGSETRIAVHCFARSAGPLAALALGSVVRDALDDAPLSLSAPQSIWWIRFVSAEPVPDAVGPTVSQVIVNLEAVTTATIV